MTDALHELTLDLIAHIDAAYEASFKVTNALDAEDPDASPLAYDVQTVLNLLKYALEHPDQENLGTNFGQLTLDALDSFYERIDFQAGPKTPPMEQAAEIGEEIRNIDSGIEQGKIAYGNANFNKPGYEPYNYYDTPLFQKLSERREDLRRQLLAIDWSTPQ